MSWDLCVKKNLLPKIIEKDVLKKAILEWFYTGDMNDLEVAMESCELCNQPNIRYQFLVRNKYNNNELFVGSECINKFGIHAIDEKGNILDSIQSKDKVKKDRRKLINNAKEKNVINSLVYLAHKDNEFKNIESFIDCYRKYKAFTPGQLSTIIWRLNECQIPYIKSNFKMTIKRKKHKEDLLKMNDWKVEKIFDCMTSSQKKLYINLKNNFK